MKLSILFSSSMAALVGLLLASGARASDPGECLNRIYFGSELSTGFKVGAGFVYTRYNGIRYQGEGFYVSLSKRNGQYATVPVYLNLFEIGATAGLEAWALLLKKMQLRLPDESEGKCVLPMDVFETFYGTGANVGAAVFIGGEIDGTKLWNKAGVSFFLGSGIGVGAIGAHAGFLPFKFLQIKPLHGFKGLLDSSPGFFPAEAVYDRINGVRDLKW